jgi:TonB family protein
MIPDPNEELVAPVMLVQLQDDLARSRKREAFWISLVLHLGVVMSLLFAPRIFPGRGVVIATPSQLINQRDLTYLDLPPDQQKPPETPPKSNIISDKNRIATTRNPSLDRKELKKILDSSRPGAPGSAQPPLSPGQQQPQVAESQQPQPGPPNPQRSEAPQPAPAQTARLEQPRTPPPGAFGSNSSSAGSLIEQAARASAASRGGGTGSGGDFGVGSAQSGRAEGGLEIMSDTMGVDFGPYLQRVLQNVKRNWYLLIPEVARPPLMKRGRVSIEFAITKDGSVAGMKLIYPSGDSSLDRAAWGGILGSNPFPPLPTEFRGDYLALRFHFYYNPDKNEMR